MVFFYLYLFLILIINLINIFRIKVKIIFNFHLFTPYNNDIIYSNWQFEKHFTFLIMNIFSFFLNKIYF